jgi:hypothetical protein
MILALRPGSEKNSAVRRKKTGPDSATPIEMGRANRLKD